MLGELSSVGRRRACFRPALLVAAVLILWAGLSNAALAEDAACTNPALPAKPDIQCSAKSIATAVDRHYNALKSLQVHFSQQYAGMGMNREESGTLLLKKPGRMRWSYAKPAGKLFVLDGKYAYFYAPGDTQVQRVPAKQLDDLRSPLRFLLGHTQLAKEMNGLTVAHAASDAFWLTGVPKGLEKRVEKMKLGVKRDGSIFQIEVEEVDGARTVFSLNDEKPNAPAADAEFIFQAPKGVPVVDGLPPV
jgi:outer membrane lipoprotein carrier protein